MDDLVINYPDWEYKIGYLYGYYKDCKGWNDYHINRQSSFWIPDDIELENPHIYAGYEDGWNDRPKNDDDYVREGAFFAFNIPGFPWGSALEREITTNGWHTLYEFDDETGKTVEWYSLTKDTAESNRRREQHHKYKLS